MYISCTHVKPVLIHHGISRSLKSCFSVLAWLYRKYNIIQKKSLNEAHPFNIPTLSSGIQSIVIAVYFFYVVFFILSLCCTFQRITAGSHGLHATGNSKKKRKERTKKNSSYPIHKNRYCIYTYILHSQYIFSGMSFGNMCLCVWQAQSKQASGQKKRTVRFFENLPFFLYSFFLKIFLLTYKNRFSCFQLLAREIDDVE
ncbi:hypothetical protein ACKWTF_010986 [Chironomus riparius]